MRQESTYNAIAVSRVGARGAMQIMPRTGHLIADLNHDTTFTAGDLEDPTLAIEYGIQYMGLLMERFDGVYPLAIASYNGGPHNVSAWLDGTGAKMPIDAWVEHIPFRETRRYVKGVSGAYARYVALYAPEGTEIVLPESPRGDHPDVVDF
jgi:soluble lytic murein transglycosylase